MLVVTRTPFRVSFFGGGTDVPEFFQRHRGAVLGAAIDRYCNLTVSDLPDCFEYRVRLAYSRVELVRNSQEIVHPVVRACLLENQIQSGVEITHFADLPARTGLGTSSSFTAGLLLALAVREGRQVEPAELAAEAIRIERTVVGESGGWQDQWFAACGGLRRFEFSADGTVSVQSPHLGPGVVEGLARCLKLYFLGVARDSSDIMRNRSNHRDRNFATLSRMLEQVDQGEDLLRSPWDPRAFGRLLDEAWQLKRSLAPDVSSKTIDTAYEAALAAGAAGGKLLGAGGSGFLLMCVPEERQRQVAAALGSMFEVSFKVAAEGARVLYREDLARL